VSTAGGVIALQPRALDIDHLRRLATRLFTDGQYLDADQVLAELADLTPGERAQIALHRAQVGMLSDRMGHVQAQLDIAREEYGAHVYFVGLEADMAVRKGDLRSAAAALRLLGRHARAAQLEGFDSGWYQVRALSPDPVGLDDAHALPLFTATVNGQSGRFVLDTGTGDCLLDTGFARRGAPDAVRHLAAASRALSELGENPAVWSALAVCTGTYAAELLAQGKTQRARRIVGGVWQILQHEADAPLLAELSALAPGAPA
jgi:hypothetical protein